MRLAFVALSLLVASISTAAPKGRPSMSTSSPVKTGYANVNDLRMYHEIRGPLAEGGTPLLLLHGGLHNTKLDAPVAERLAQGRQVISVDLQGHGRTADATRPLRYEQLADDVAALLAHLGVKQADVLGYSLGGGVGLRLAIQHPSRVRKLAVVSAPFSSAGWYPEVAAAFQHLTGAIADRMKPAPVYQTFAAIAPDPAGFARLVDKTGELQRRPYDWSVEVSKLAMPVLLVFADADSMPPSYIAQFYGLLGGGQRDGGLDGSGRAKAGLAILPGRTHYDLFECPEMIAVVEPFLSR